MISITAPGTLTRGEYLVVAPGNIESVISRASFRRARDSVKRDGRRQHHPVW
jgi:hypothetical protein